MTNVSKIDASHDAAFAAAGKAYDLPIDLLKAAAEQEVKNGQPPIIDDDEAKKIAKERGIKGDLNSPENQWQIYIYALAAQENDYLNTPKTASAILNPNPQVDDLFQPHGNSIHIDHRSTGSAYIPSQFAVSLIERFEGFIPKSTQHREDPPKVVTIGYGHTNNAIHNRDLSQFDPLTKEKAAELLVADLQDYGAAITQKFPGFLNLPQSMQDACVSYSFNCGVGALMKSQAMNLIKDGHLQEGAAALANGIHTAKGVPLPGLVKRRTAEAQLAAVGLQDNQLATKTAPITSQHTNLQATPIAFKDDANGKQAARIADAGKLPDVHPAVIQHAVAALNAMPASTTLS